MKRSTLLIGGAGYIGPVVARELLNLGHEVTILDNLIYDNKYAVNDLFKFDNFSFIEGEMGDVKVLAEAMKGIDSVVLLAGLVGDPITKKYPQAATQINDVQLGICIQYLSKISLERFIFISTCSNYGLIPDDKLADETHQTSPLSSYAKSKVEAENLILSLADSANFFPTILRFATAFGLAPRMRFDLTVNEFTRELLLGNQLVVYDPDTWRPYCHVRDFAQIVKLVLEAPRDLVINQIFNAGGEINNARKRDVVNLIAKHVPSSKIVFRDNGVDPRNYRVDFRKIRDTLDFEPTFTIEMGVIEILSRYQKNFFEKKSLNVNYFGNYSLDYP